MKWVKFPDGSSYTFASDIQKLAEAHGYNVPCDPNGTRHPGTDCNVKMRTIFKDAGMRRTFGVNESSVVDVVVEDAPYNRSFLEWLIANGIVSASYARQKSIQLYTKSAVNALLSLMLKTHVEYEQEDTDEVWNCNISITTKNHNLEKKRNKPKASLFSK